jgi:hypothetical protein
MIPDMPSEEQLLQTARAALKDDILPLLPEEKRLELLMILNALGIAERRIADSQDQLTGRQNARLASLAGVAADAKAFAAQIRSGFWATPEQLQQLWQVLWDDAQDRLARANPKYLDYLD